MQNKKYNLEESVFKKNFNHTTRFWGCDENFYLIIGKGIYLCECMDGWKENDETSLPPKDAFYSRLNMKGISDQYHEHAQQVWNRITPEHENITLGDNYDMYLATDVLLLADEFEAFQNTCLKHYKLDPAHFYTASGLAWQVLLTLFRMDIFGGSHGCGGPKSHSHLKSVIDVLE